jgi:hypothetical protein
MVHQTFICALQGIISVILFLDELINGVSKMTASQPHKLTPFREDKRRQN